MTLVIEASRNVQPSLLDPGLTSPPESSTKEVAMTPTLCSFCVPAPLSQEDFASLLTRSQRGGHARTELTYSTTSFSRPKKVCRLVTRYLQSHEVECVSTEESKAVCSSLCSCVGGVYLCILLKVMEKRSGGSGSLSVEVKCLDKDERVGGYGREVCQQAAEAIVMAIELMDLQ